MTTHAFFDPFGAFAAAEAAPSRAASARRDLSYRDLLGEAWWRLPAYWRANRERLLAHNGGYFLSGYGEIARRWLFAPVFAPAHPRW